MPDYEAAIRMLNENCFHYYTYSVNGKKNIHAFVLKGMSHKHTEESILSFVKNNIPLLIYKKCLK